MRTKNNMVVSQMRDTFDYWHLGREFDTASPPVLNASFLTCTPERIYLLYLLNRDLLLALVM